jgi:hypothetical protein
MFVPPDTQCKDCIFYDKHIDCRIGRAKFYKDNGIKVLRTDDGTIIKNFICPYYRTIDWLEEKKDISNPVLEIQKENKLPYIPVILYLNGKILEETLNKIANFDTPPEMLYVIIKEEELIQKTKETIENALKDTNIKWNLHLSLEEDSWHVIFKNYNRREFLLIINGYPQVNKKWPKVLTKKIQDELLKFSYAENKSQTMMLISPYIYNMYYFDYGKKFIQMLRLERNKQKCIL